MKLLHGVFLCAIALCSEGTYNEKQFPACNEIPEGISLFHSGDVTTAIAKFLANQFIQRLEKSARAGMLNLDENQPFATLLPPRPDPDCFLPGTIPVNYTLLDPSLEMYGEIGYPSEVYVHGFSEIQDELTATVVLGAINLDWNFSLPEYYQIGDFMMNLTIIRMGSKEEVEGTGQFTVNMSNIFITSHAKIKAPVLPPQHTGVLEFEIDFGFKNFNMDGGNVTIGNDTIDWENLSSNIQYFFDAIWNPVLRERVNEQVGCSIDHAINDCTIFQIINGELDCLKWELNPECFGQDPQPTTTTPPTTTTTSSSTTTPPPGQLFSCSGREDGFYPHTSECDKYYGCRNGQAEEFQCSIPLLYNADTRGCAFVNLVDCDLSCYGKADGFYPHSFYCHLFIGCQSNERYILQCDSPLLFDPVTKNCNYPDMMECFADY